MNKRIAIVLVLLLLLVAVFAACDAEEGGLALPEYELPTLTAAYGQTLGDITLPEGFSWQDELTTSVGEVGSRVFLVTYTPSDPLKFKTVTDLQVTITVTKGETTPSALTTLTTTYGTFLGDIELPAGFAWEDPEDTLVGAVGERTFNVFFTPADTEHYEVVRGLPVTLVVQKATYDMTNIAFTDDGFIYDGTEKSLLIFGALPEGVTVAYENNGKTAVGTYDVVAHFTGDADNYNAIEDMTATLTIVNATFSGITFRDVTVTYDGAAHAIAVAGAPANATVHYTAANEQTNAGVYSVTAEIQNENYETLQLTATLTIEKATYDMSGVTFANADFVYDGTEKTIVIAGNLPEDVTVSYEGNALTKAGKTAATARFTIADAKNYNAIADMTAELRIAKASYDMTGVTFTDKTETYDATPKSVLIAGELPAGVSVAYDHNVQTNVGSTEATARFTVADEENYNVPASMTATLTVEKAAAVIDVSGVLTQFTYDGEEKSISGATAMGTTAVTYENNAFTDAGTYEVVVCSAASDNYLAGRVTVVVTVEKGDATLNKANATTAYTYDGKSHTLTGLVASGETTFTYNDEAFEGAKNAGSYGITVSVAESKNRLAGTFTVYLTIAKKQITIAANAQTSVYGEALAALTATAELAEGDAAESVYTLEKEAGDTVGEYEISVNVVPNDNYEVTQTANARYTITKATYDMTGVTFANKTVTYDGSEKTITISGDLPQGVSVDYQNNARTNAGEITATASFTGDAQNYFAIEDMTAKLTIAKATYDMSGVTFANKAATYDGAEKSIEITGDLPQGVSVRYENNTRTNAGETTATAIFTGDAENYTAIENMTATLTINKAAARLLNDLWTKSYTYDGHEHWPAGMMASGSIKEFRYNGEVVTGFTNVGVYTFDVYVNESANFLSGVIEGLTFSITKAPLTVRADNKEISYGSEAPTFTASISGFVNGETEAVLGGAVAFATSYEVGSNVGNYAITPSGYTSDNYEITFQAGNLHVCKADPALVVTPMTKEYDGYPATINVTHLGNAEPTFLYKLTGAEDETYTEDVPSDKGDYTVKVTIAETSNYLGATATADFRITNTWQTITITTDLSKDYDGAPVGAPEFTGKESTGPVTIEYKRASAGDNTYTTTAPTDAGEYVVRVIVVGDANFDTGIATRAFTIRQIFDPSYVLPAGLTSMYKKTLADVELPEGWAWDEGTDAYVGDAGDRTHAATFLPSDLVNYKTVMLDLTIAVAKAHYAAPTYFSLYAYDSDATIAEIIPNSVLPEGWSWKDGNTFKPASQLQFASDNAAYYDCTGHQNAYVTCPGDANHDAQANVCVTLHIVKVTPTLTFTGSLDTLFGYDAGSTKIDAPKTVSDQRIGMGNSPSENGIYGGNMPIHLFEANDSVVTLFKQRGVGGEGSYSSTKPTAVGQYTCKMYVNSNKYHFAANAIYVDFEIEKGEALIAFDTNATGYNQTTGFFEAEMESNPKNYVNVTMFGTHGVSGGALTYTYVSYGADGVFGTADDGEETATAPTTAGKYHVRCEQAETSTFKAGEATCELELKKMMREAYTYAAEYTYCVGEPFKAEYQVSLVKADDEWDIFPGTVNYKPLAAEDSAYTATLPMKPGVYSLRITIPETSYFYGQTLYATITYEIFHPSYYYQGEDYTLLFATPGEDYTINYLCCYVYEGLHTIEECLLIDAIEYVENVYVKTGKDFYIEYYPYDETLGKCVETYFEIKDEATGELMLFQNGTAQYVFTTVSLFDGEEKAETLVFTDAGGVLRVIWFEGAFTVETVPGEDGEYVGIWAFDNEQETRIRIVESFDLKNVLFEILPNGNALKMMTGEIEYLCVFNAGEEQNPVWETVTFNVLNGRKVSFHYAGALTKENVGAATPMLLGTEWTAYEGAEAILESVTYFGSYLYLINENGTLTRLESRTLEGVCEHENYDFWNYFYFYSYDSKYDVYTTTTVFITDYMGDPRGRRTYAYRVTAQGTPAKPFTLGELLDAEFRAAHMDAFLTVTFAVTDEWDGITLEGIDSGIFYYDQNETLTYYPGLQNWYYETNEGERAGYLYAEKNGKITVRYFDGLFDETTVLHALASDPGFGGSTFRAETYGDYLYVLNKREGYAESIYGIFVLDGHLLSIPELGDPVYVYGENYGTENDPKWETVGFYVLGKYGWAIPYEIAPTALNGYEGQCDAAKRWEKEGDYLYVCFDYGDVLAFAVDGNGVVTKAPITVERVVVEYDEGEGKNVTTAYVLVGNKGLIRFYYEELDAAAVLINPECELWGTWVRSEDLVFEYAFDGALTGVWKVVTDGNGDEQWTRTYGDVIYFANRQTGENAFEVYVFTEVGGVNAAFLFNTAEAATAQTIEALFVRMPDMIYTWALDTDGYLCIYCGEECVVAFEEKNGAWVESYGKPVYFCIIAQGKTYCTLLVLTEIGNLRKFYYVEIEGAFSTLADIALDGYVNLIGVWERGDPGWVVISVGPSMRFPLEILSEETGELINTLMAG